MVARKRNIRWDKDALAAFENGICFIGRSSPQAATRVKLDILKRVAALSLRLEIHPPYKYKRPNDGSYRAFEQHRYRIAYHVSETEIIVVRVRHTAMEPNHY